VEVFQTATFHPGLAARRGSALAAAVRRRSCGAQRVNLTTSVGAMKTTDILALLLHFCYKYQGFGSKLTNLR
jgi:hypothetical protein